MLLKKKDLKIIDLMNLDHPTIYVYVCIQSDIKSYAKYHNPSFTLMLALLPI